MEVKISRNLEALIESPKRAQSLAQELEEQRRSFVYGNTAIENELITREMIEQQAVIVSHEGNDHGKR